MIEKLKKVFTSLLNLSIFVFLSVIIFRILWGWFGQEYVFGNQTVGSDYFNALTYQIHFSKYNPNPISSWLPFWHEGSPIIGGYPHLSFYLTNYLTKLYDVAVAMNIFSIGSLYLFFIACLLLFWQVSKNWLIAATLTIVAATTQASFYQLTVGGFISSAATQWYLPATLYFLFKFHESSKTTYIVLSGLFVGISILSHGPTGFLLIFLPTVAMLAVLPQGPKNLGVKVRHLLLFTTISLGVGAIGLYTMIIKTLLGSGAGGCASPECWGDYPKHLILWLSATSPILAAAFFVVSAISKIFKRNPDFSLVPAILVGSLVLFLYQLTAYLKLIDGLANIVFPTRTFWAINLFLLLAAASLFKSFQKSLGPASHFVATFTFLVVILVTLANPFQIKTDEPNTIPRDVASYITAKPPKPISEIIPDWVLAADNNWRIDILNPGVIQWWNTLSQLPQVRGYSNDPLGIHRDWQYFLQSATRDVPEEVNHQLAKNRALFLLDAFGVKFFDNSLGVYPKSISEDSQIIVNKDIETFYFGKFGNKITSPKNLQFYQLSEEITTPVVHPTNSPPVLFVGDDKGYENFIRTIAMVNVNSAYFVPIKGPSSLKNITREELKIFPAVIIYQSADSNLEKLSQYVKDGGKVFIDTASFKFRPDKLPEIIPFELLTEKDVPPSQNWQKDDVEEVTKAISTDKFSTLSFEEGTWRISAPEHLKSWAKTFIRYQNYPILAGGKLGNGYVIWSGFNLPFHIVDNNNLQEAQLFKNILIKLLEPKNTAGGNFRIERPKSELISVEGKNYNGIYFKENYDSGWQAHVGSQKLKVYKAGLEFMYIPTPQKDSLNVNIQYKGATIAWLLAFSTIFIVAISLLYALFPRLMIWIFSIPVKLLGSRFKRKLGKILEEE